MHTASIYTQLAPPRHLIVIHELTEAGLRYVTRLKTSDPHAFNEYIKERGLVMGERTEAALRELF